MIARAAALGIALGVTYTLSPLSVVAAAAFATLVYAATSIEDPRERRLLVTMVTLAIALRVLAVAGLFLWTDHHAERFGTFFGDEDYFIKRALWLRNVALDVPISPADMRYAFDPDIETSLVWILAAIQIVFGPAPYGVHLLGILAYVAGVLMLYAAVRPSFGAPAALIGIGLLLFLPSLFSWSISALKDPLFLALLCAALALTQMARRMRLAWQLAAGLGVGVIVALAETLRSGGLALLGLAIAGGLLAAAAWRRPRLAGVVMAVLIIASAAALTRGQLRDALVVGAHRAVQAHWDHVHASGSVYRLLDDHRYARRLVIPTLGVGETARYAARAIVAYVSVPLPWQVQSRTALAFVPEQLVWLGVVTLAAVGVAAGLRRDPTLTLLLVVSAIVLAAGVALTSGNIGTLVRHRSLAVMPLAWLAGLGAISALTWTARTFGLSPIHPGAD